MVRRGHLHTVALGEAALGVTVDGHALQPARVVAQLLAGLASYGYGVALAVGAGRTRILSGLDPQRLRPFRVADHVALFVVLRVLPVGPCDVRSEEHTSELQP